MVEPIKIRRERFELSKQVYRSEVLKFDGVNGRDVYNCSVPFDFEGKRYIFGRVEKREEWANSVTLLFCRDEKSGVWKKVDAFDALPLEDPFVSVIRGEYIVGGTHVIYEAGRLADYSTYFYKGKSPFSLRLFSVGPSNMKDIRLFEIPDGRVGVFSRPRGEHVREQFGSESIVGLTVLDSLEQLTPERIENARYIHGMFGKDEWGGVNQAFYLKDNLVGAIGHQCYSDPRDGVDYQVYVNMAYVIDMSTFEVVHKEVIGTSNCYPDTPAKLKALADCAFTSGIEMSEDGKARLYSGLRDCCEGMTVINDPFRAIV